MQYSHTQSWYLAYFVIAIITFVWSMFYFSIDPVLYKEAWLMFLFIAIVLSSFWSLTVSIDHQHLKIKFGFWLFFKKFLLSEIQSVKQVKNKRYYGRWIRYRLWPRMTIFNVRGYDAVELVLKNWRVVRIWTDEPIELLTSLKASLPQ